MSSATVSKCPICWQNHSENEHVKRNVVTDISAIESGVKKFAKERSMVALVADIEDEAKLAQSSGRVYSAALMEETAKRLWLMHMDIASCPVRCLHDVRTLEQC